MRCDPVDDGVEPGAVGGAGRCPGSLVHRADPEPGGAVGRDRPVWHPGRAVVDAAGVKIAALEEVEAA